MLCGNTGTVGVGDKVEARFEGGTGWFPSICDVTKVWRLGFSQSSKACFSGVLGTLNFTLAHCREAD